MTDEPTIDVVNNRRAVRVPGHGIVAATGRPNAVPDTDEVRFLIDCGALEHAPATPSRKTTTPATTEED